MTATWMTWSVTYLMHSTLLIAAVALAARWIRSAPARDVLWKLALAGAIVTATLQTAMPFDSVLPEAAPRRVTLTVDAAGPGTPQTVAPSTPAGAPEMRMPSVRSLAVLGWLAGAAFLLIRLLYGRRRFLTTLATRRELVLGADRTILDELCVSMGISHIVRLTQSPSIGSPMAMPGWEIVVPAGVFARLSEEQRRTILAHELAHLQRRDPLWLTAAEVVKAVLFFQPLHWYVQARMKETAEFLCDDAAVAQTGDRRALAETLAELAESVTPLPASVAAMAEGGSNLIARVTRVLRAQAADLPLRLRSRIAIAFVPLVAMALFAPGVVPALTSTAATLSTKAGTPKKALTQGGRFNHFSDGSLSHTYEGPDGNTNIRFDAKNASIALDGSSVRFDSSNGFVRVVYTSERGPKQVVRVTPGAGNEPVYYYEAGGKEKAWCADAEVLIAAAFRTKELQEVKAERERAEPSQWRTWNADVELTGTRDGEPTEIRIRAVDVRHDPATGVLEFHAGSSLEITERVGSRRRGLTANERETIWHGDWRGESIEGRLEWAAELVRKNTSLKGIVLP